MTHRRRPTGVRRRVQLGLEALERRDLLAYDLTYLLSKVDDRVDALWASDQAVNRAIAEYTVDRTGSRESYTGASLTGDRLRADATGAALLELLDTGTQYRLEEVKHGLASSHSRYQQVFEGIDVYGGTASIHMGADGTIQALHVDSYDHFELSKMEVPSLGLTEAAQVATTANAITESFGESTGNLVWYPSDKGEMALAWRTQVRSINPVGDFETIVDAKNGDVLASKNLAVFDDGQGSVFQPNPYQTQGSGSGLTDSNDATSAALEAQEEIVTLKRLDSGTGLIRGEWVDLSTLNSPTLPDVDADESTRVYNYNRDDARFEQVVIYHAIDSIQEYIHSLGFDDDVGIANGIRDFPTLANAHWSNDDQSFYSTGDDAVHFGDGGVDDGEDADIIAHEYGHAIQHDQNAFWGGGEMGAMGEGFGDYLAASFYADDGDAAFQSLHVACVGEWDATSYSGTNPPCLRRVDGSKMYPEDIVGQVHADGEIWSRALWDIRAAIGVATTDQLVFEHHFGLPANATMPDAALAILTADHNLNAGANQAAIRQAFVDRGILEDGPAGIVQFNARAYGAGDTIGIELNDSDLTGVSTVDVAITTAEGDTELVTLNQVVGSEFFGTITSVEGSPVTSNGTLEVTVGEEITVTYNDADDGTGNPAVVTDTAMIESIVVLLDADFSDDSGLPFDEGFIVSGPANEWHLSTGRGNDGGHSADDSFYFGSGEGPTGGGEHTNNSDGTITSPMIDLTNVLSASVTFNHLLESEQDYDFASVNVIAGGSSTQIASTANGSLPIRTTGFEQHTLDLSAFIGQSIQIAFQFTSDFSVTNEGWYVDDVVVNAELDDGPTIPEDTGQWLNQGPIGANHRFLEALTPGNSIGGATHTVVAHPTDPDILYIGTVNGGIWKSTNATELLPIWEPQTDAMASLSIGAIAFDPTDATHNTLVATTARYSSFGGVGGDRGAVYRTTDGGATWTDGGSAGLAGENLSGIAARGDTIVVTSSAAAGGIHRSTDGGATFNVIEDADFVAIDNFSDLVEDPANSDRLYAANSAGGPGGIYRSDDFGASWVKITGASIDSEMNDLLAESNNIEMAVSPQTGRLYVAILLSSQPEAIYHTNDGNAASPTWTRMDVPVLPQGSGMPISAASNSSPIVIQSPGHGLTEPSRGVNFVVIDGVTGNTAANGFHRVSIIDANSFELSDTVGSGAYTGGGTWTKVASPNPTPKNEPEAGAQGRTHFSIVVDPTDEDILYVGGDRQDQPNLIGGVNISGAIFRGDASLARNPNLAPSPQWDHLTHDIVDFDPDGGTASGSAPHADSREMVFDATGNLIEVDDGGVYKRTEPTDNTGDWFSLIGNLSATEFHDVAYDSVSNTIIGGLQDNGTLYQPASGATFWNILSGGDGGDVAVDDVSRANVGQSIRYTSFQNLDSFRKTTWDHSGSRIDTSFPSLNVISGSDYDPYFNTPVALNHVDPNRLLFGMDNGIYESTDQGETISAVAPQISPTGSTSGNAIDYGGRSSGSDNPFVAYVGDFDGNVHVRTTNGGAFLSSNPSGGTTSNIVDVMMDPDEWQNAFAVDFDQVFTTNNSGGLWSDITGNLSGVGASGFRSLQFIAGAVDALILGTNTGIYASLTSALGTWFEMGAGLPNAVVFDLDYDAADDVLVAGTMGRGVWLLDNVTERLVESSSTATVSLNASNNLVITDADGNQSDDLMIQSDTTNNQFVITGVDQTINTSIAGATGSGTDTVTIPFAEVAGPTIVVDLLGGRDILTVDFALGDFAKQIAFDGGLPDTGRGDVLRLSGGASFTDAVFNFTGPDSGTIDITGNSTITYTGLEPIESELAVQNVVLNYTDAAETISISPHGEELGGIHVGSSAAENVSFPIPGGSLTIDGGDTGDNTINMIGAFLLGGASLDLTGDQVTLDGAMVLTEGSGSIHLTAERNLLLDDNTRLITIDGDITLRGNSDLSPASGDFDGIVLDQATVSTVNGDILMVGRGGDEVGGSFNRGIQVVDRSVIESTGTGASAGTITLIGRGGDAANGNRGVQFGTPGSRVSSIDGDIVIAGTGGDGSAGFNQGIILFDGKVESTGSGPDAATITLDGTAGQGVESNVGIFVLGSGQIASVDGDIFLNGVGNGTSNFNSGVVLSQTALIESTGIGEAAANISIHGTGADANQSNRGIQMSSDGPLPQISSIDGAIDLVGDGGNGSSGFNHGLALFDGLIQSTGQGDINLSGTANGNGGNGVALFDQVAIEAVGEGDIELTATASGTASDFLVNNGPSTIGSPAGTGAITVTADIMNFDGLAAFQGQGDLTLQPRNPATTVGIGGGSGTLNINDAELSRISDGFNSITIGDAAAGTGNVDLNSSLFLDATTVAGGQINLDSINAGANDVRLIARTGSITNSNAQPNITGGVVTLTGSVEPGLSPGILNVTAEAVAFDDNDEFVAEIGGTTPGSVGNQHDQLNVAGAVSIGSNVTLSATPLNGFSPSDGQTFVIVNNDGTDVVTGFFAGLPEGTSIGNFLGSGLNAVISYEGGDGNDVVLIIGSFDFGDAPAPYPTTLSANGARHLAKGPRLGPERDSEADGQPSAAADGDDVDIDDEDGVLFGTIAAGSALAGVNIDLQNAAAARVDAWIDFDGNGDFDPADQILSNVQVSSGLQTLNFSVPAGAAIGTTVARVRVSSVGGLGPEGAASDGEVEDYQVQITQSKPQVETVVINQGLQQRSIVTELVVTFDREVDAPASAFEISNRDSLLVVSSLIVNSSVVNGKTVSVLTFGPGNGVQTRANGIHSLLRGNYRLDIASDQISQSGGGPNMASDYVFGANAIDGFFRKFGDGDGDRQVGLLDFAAFRQTFGRGNGDSQFRSEFDEDGDDIISLIDFATFRRNYGS